MKLLSLHYFEVITLSNLVLGALGLCGCLEN